MIDDRWCPMTTTYSWRSHQPNYHVQALISTECRVLLHCPSTLEVKIAMTCGLKGHRETWAVYSSFWEACHGWNPGVECMDQHLRFSPTNGDEYPSEPNHQPSWCDLQPSQASSQQALSTLHACHWWEQGPQDLGVQFSLTLAMDDILNLGRYVCHNMSPRSCFKAKPRRGIQIAGWMEALQETSRWWDACTVQSSVLRFGDSFWSLDSISTSHSTSLRSISCVCEAKLPYHCFTLGKRCELGLNSTCAAVFCGYFFILFQHHVRAFVDIWIRREAARVDSRSGRSV